MGGILKHFREYNKKIRNMYDNVEKQKKELLELGYDAQTIDEYLIYLE